MRFNYKHFATIQRLSAYSSNKSSKQAFGSVIRGFFRPLTNTESVQQYGTIGQSYLFITDGATDIRPSDQLTIDNVIYNVKGISRFKHFSQDTLRVSLEKSVNIS
jgi:hypothetical protein